MDWKLKRGKWRPRLLDFAKQADPAAVEAASRAAFEALGGAGGSVKGGGKASSKAGGSSEASGSQEVPQPTEAAVKQALAELCVLKVCAHLEMEAGDVARCLPWRCMAASAC